MYDDGRSELSAVSDLHERRDLRHDDRDRDVEFLTVVCQRQALVPCTCRYYTTRLLLLYT